MRGGPWQGLFGAHLNFPASVTLPDGADVARPGGSGRGAAGGQGPRQGWACGCGVFGCSGLIPEHQGCPSGPVEEKRYRAGGRWAWDGHANVGLLFGPSMLRTKRSPNSGGGNWVCCVMCPSLIKCLLFCALGVNFLLSDVCSVGFGEARAVRGPRWGLWGLMCFSCKCAWCLVDRGEGGCDPVSVGTQMRPHSWK